MAGKMERAMQRRGRYLVASGDSSLPKRMAGKMETVMAKEKKVLIS